MSGGVDDRPEFDELVSFITTYARVAQKYFGYSYETELALHRIINGLGLHCEIFTTPNILQIALWRDDASRQTMHLAVTMGIGYDLNKVAQIDDVASRVTNGQVSLRQGQALLKQIEGAPAIYGLPQNALAFVMTGAGFAAIIGASWLDILLGGLLGLISLVMVRLGTRLARVAIIAEILAAAFAAFLATALSVAMPGIRPLVIAVCAVTWFMPGFGLTIAPREMLYGNTLAGLVLITNATLVFIKLFAGGTLGYALAMDLLHPPNRALLPVVDPAWVWVLGPTLTVGLAILFRVAPRHLPLIVVGTWLVWAGVVLGSQAGPWQGTFLGAFVLAVLSSLGTRRGIHSATLSLPLIMLLVPGYAFLRALYVMSAQGTETGLSVLSAVTLAVAAILAGIFMGDAIVSTGYAGLRFAGRYREGHHK
ncbi:hypothetical protein PROP_02663 [Propionicimonas sp. T2.31MG-18]|uniref:threonine/serine ThrE exporter family protein n=1 Tax=Propionicimonas sp. T2.31MG-18 TaxID=3157620 RepID=UPI0035EB5DEF